MGSVNVTAIGWRQIEVGRVVMFKDSHRNSGRIAAIVEIIDHKRVLVDGPSDNEDRAVERVVAHTDDLMLTATVLQSLPRGARRGVVKKFWTKAKVDEQFSATGWAKKLEERKRRRGLTDFDRFKAMRQRAEKRHEVQMKAVKAK